jgi:hypothetical protein
MNAMQKALAMIGMTTSDMERTDFINRAGRKAAAALRSMGYKRTRFKTMAGHGVYATRWAKVGVPPTMQECPSFNVLVMAVANDIAVEAK